MKNNYTNKSNEANKIIQKYYLNEELLEVQKVPEENILQMPKYYDKLKDLFKSANENFDETKEKIVSNKIADKIGKELEDVESNLQKLWNFKNNSDYFTYWNTLPGCRCSKEDNKESYGVYRIINCECPYHKHLCTKEGL